MTVCPMCVNRAILRISDRLFTVPLCCAISVKTGCGTGQAAAILMVFTPHQMWRVFCGSKTSGARFSCFVSRFDSCLLLQLLMGWIIQNIASGFRPYGSFLCLFQAGRRAPKNFQASKIERGLMCTQKELAVRVGITQPGVSDFLSRTGIDIKPMTPEDAVLSYCAYLRESAAGRKGAERGEVFDLATERAKTERLKQDALRLQIAEKSKSLLPVDEIRDGLIPMMQAIRTNVLAIPGKVVQQAKALKDIDLEIEFIEDIVYDALKSCSEIDVSRQLESVVSVASGVKSSTAYDDNGMGEGVSEDEQ